jgi:prepilin-type N-terminal cleavage/methylation domain-containing protein
VSRGTRCARAGFTLLETTVALSIFALVTAGLLSIVRVGARSQQNVIERAENGRSMRDVSSQLIDELRQTSDGEITVTALADGNSQLTFRQPILVDGDLLWGVYDTSLGTTPEEQTQENWKVRYTVEAVAAGGATKRNLLRQLLDAADVVQSERVVARGLCSGGGAAPGFEVADAGAVWVVTLSLEGDVGADNARSVVFHVNTLN